MVTKFQRTYHIRRHPTFKDYYCVHARGMRKPQSICGARLRMLMHPIVTRSYLLKGRGAKVVIKYWVDYAEPTVERCGVGWKMLLFRIGGRYSNYRWLNLGSKCIAVWCWTYACKILPQLKDLERNTYHVLTRVIKLEKVPKPKKGAVS